VLQNWGHTVWLAIHLTIFPGKMIVSRQDSSFTGSPDVEGSDNLTFISFCNNTSGFFVHRKALNFVRKICSKALLIEHFTHALIPGASYWIALGKQSGATGSIAERLPQNFEDRSQAEVALLRSIAAI
jgi:hypothetical protein